MTGISEHNDNLIAATLAAAIIHKWNQLSGKTSKDATCAVAVYYEVQKALKAQKEGKEL
jgi:hypothetical protein